MLDFLNQPVGGTSDVPVSRTVPMGNEIGSPSGIADLGVMKQPNTNYNWAELLKMLQGMEGGGSASQFMELLKGLSPTTPLSNTPTSLAAVPKQNTIPQMGNLAPNAYDRGSSDSQDMADIMSVIQLFG